MHLGPGPGFWGKALVSALQFLSAEMGKARWWQQMFAKLQAVKGADCCD